MANGKISIDTDYANNIMSYFNNSISNLDGTVSSKLSSSFQAIEETGLMSNSLSKIQNQVKKVTGVEESIVNSIASHIDNVTNSEIELYNSFMSGLNKNNEASSLDDEEETPKGGVIEIDEKDDGKSVNTNAVVEIINSLTDEDKEDMLILLEMYKDSDVSLKDLLLNNEKSSKLYKTLNNILFNEVDSEVLQLEDTKEVQKKLLDSIVNGETENVELNNNSILVAKEYLIDVSKNNNISVSDLLLNDENSELLKESLINLYNDKEEAKGFKEYIDKIAFDNNISVENLINNNIELIY